MPANRQVFGAYGLSPLRAGCGDPESVSGDAPPIILSLSTSADTRTVSSVVIPGGHPSGEAASTASYRPMGPTAGADGKAARATMGIAARTGPDCRRSGRDSRPRCK